MVVDDSSYGPSNLGHIVGSHWNSFKRVVCELSERHGGWEYSMKKDKLVLSFAKEANRDDGVAFGPFIPDREARHEVFARKVLFTYRLNDDYALRGQNRTGHRPAHFGRIWSS
jgi:hypothetical protein